MLREVLGKEGGQRAAATSFIGPLPDQEGRAATSKVPFEGVSPLVGREGRRQDAQAGRLHPSGGLAQAENPVTLPPNPPSPPSFSREVRVGGRDRWLTQLTGVCSSGLGPGGGLWERVMEEGEAMSSWMTEGPELG